MIKKYDQNTIVNYLKNYGFVYQNSEIYNGLSNSWDFGPLGVLLKNNIKALWWGEFVTQDDNIVGLDSAILSHNKIWEASGHLQNFSDPLIDCKNCKNRFRADKLVNEFNPKIAICETTLESEITKIIKDHNICCPNCNKFEWTAIRKFNLMFKTNQGPIDSNENIIYLRPETAQGIFVNFKNILRTSRRKIPFGVAQIGKSFRNEITPGNFIFRTREFEQMEIEYFSKPENGMAAFETYLSRLNLFLTSKCNINKDYLQQAEHSKQELSHYSARTVDYNFYFPHGWGELCGLAYRTNYDLAVHQEFSKKDLTYLDQTTNEKYLPHIVEPSIGVDRLLYAIVCANYQIEELSSDDSREILKLPLSLCPYKIAVFPLVKKLNNEAYKIFKKILKFNISATFDSVGSIGKRYRRQDAIGTKYCLTFDFDSLEKQTITIRERDSMTQHTISIDQLENFLKEKIIFWNEN